MYGLPACYWLIDEGEEKDSKGKKNGERKANNEKKMESINHLPRVVVYSFLLELTLQRKPLMTLSGTSQHDLVTFVLCICWPLHPGAPWRADVAVNPKSF